MSDDPKGLLDGLGDLDWDSALDEWEKNSFIPAVAPDADDKAKLAEKDKESPQAPSAPGLADDVAAGAADVAEETQDAIPALAAADENRPPPSDPALGATVGGTVIAPVPRELRPEPSSASDLEASHGSAPPARPSSPASRGGLDQLFSRPRNTPPGKPPLPVSHPSSEKTQVMPTSEKTQVAPPPVPQPTLDLRPRPGSERTLIAAPPATPPLSDKFKIAQPTSERTQVGLPPPLDKAPPPLGPPPRREPSGRPVALTSDPESERTLVRASPSAPPALPPAEEEASVEPSINVEEGEPSVDVAVPPVGRPPPVPRRQPRREEQPDDETNELPAIRSAGTTQSMKSLATRVQRLEDTGENETLIRKHESMSDADTQTRLPADDEMPTIGRPSKAPAAGGARWLDPTKTAAFVTRIAWLEEEARATFDPSTRARALLAISELAAIVGDEERALAFATEARETAPHLPLTWRQARQLMPPDPDLLVEALDAEAARSPTPSSRVHATLLAADILRIHDLGDAAVERWDSACKLDPADTRGPIARAALALAQNDHSSGALRLSDNSELIAFDKAIATALRLRGVERPEAEVDEMPINDGLRHARSALGSGDVVAAAQAVATIASVPEMTKGALWLSSAIGAAHIASRRAAARSLKTLAAEGESLARRQLAARGIELGDPELVGNALSQTIEGDKTFSVAERVTLRMLATTGKETSAARDAALDQAIAELSAESGLMPLEDALSALFPKPSADDERPDEAALERARRVAGKKETRALATLGRLLAVDKAPDIAIDEALEDVPDPRPPSAGGVAIETAVRGRRWAELSEALSSLPTSDAEGMEGSEAQRHIAAAIVAERANNRERAREAWSAAARGTALYDGILRIAADLDRDLDLGAGLLRLAEAMPDGMSAAVLRLEGVARSSLDDDELGPILERAHRAAPNLGIAGFLAERIGRRRGDLDEVLRWIQERRAYANGPLETALDAVREALLIADRDPELASTRLLEAHQARPDDVALRELHERLADGPLSDRGDWREKRASAQTGSAAALLWIEAALEHERAGDIDASVRAARRAAHAGDRGLSRPMIVRGEEETGETAKQTEELILLTKTADDETIRREALERLAHLDAFAKKDFAAASGRHRSILERTPHHKPSLRWLEHALITEGRDDELAPIFEEIALALDGGRGGEVAAHAQLAARFRVRDAASGTGNPWERTQDMARLAASQPEASLWALRALNAHSRVQKDDEAFLSTTLALLDRTQRPPERASLLLRASEAAARLADLSPEGRGSVSVSVEDARKYLEQAANEDPGDVVTWGFLAEVRGRAGDGRLAAEACESLARTSVVKEHQLLAWHDAAKIWLDEVQDQDRAMSALESAAEIDATYADIFPRLSAIYADKHLDSELARLLEMRLATIQDEGERVALEVELARAFAEMGELAKAKSALESALETRPDHTTALSAMADLCEKEADWNGAEQALVRLARLLTDDKEQKAVYERLGEIYSTRAPNLSRAEVALREVLKRSPADLEVLAKLVDVYKRMGDVPRAVETQQEIVGHATDPDARLRCLVELARIYENIGRDPRRSEQVLDSARKEFPTSVIALRAMAEFYARQRQMPAMQILLDRAAGDARRSFAQGRFVPSLFQVLHAAFELRGKRDAARVVAATLAAVEGQESDLMGADARAVDPRLDDLLAPDVMSPALRALLFRAGDSLDAVAPVDLRTLRAAPLQPGTPIGATVGSVATVIGLGALQILVSPQLGRVAIPLASNPPTLLVGEGLAKVKNERARVFVVVRAMKMILAHASAMVRSAPQDVAPLVAGLFNAFNPSYVPQGVDPKRVADYARRVGPALPRNLDPTVGVIALEAAGMLGNAWNMLGPAAASWANRVALLAVGDPNAALEAIAWDKNEARVPTGSEERAAWIARHPEARELMTFSVTDTYAEARAQLGLDK
jgi:cellulose synthase operon protein C